MTQHNYLKQSNAIWGILLILGGLFFLAENLGLFGGLTDLFWVAAFGAGGLFFLYLFLNQRPITWWAAIPGCVLLGLAGVIFFDAFAPPIISQFTGSLFLASIGLGFVLAYLSAAQNWWAIIPSGVLLTLAMVAGVDKVGMRWFDTGGLFFVGLGLTFWVLTLLPGHQQNLRWAYIPAAVLLIMGVLIGFSATSAINYVWPIALIVGGLLMIWRQLGGKKGANGL
jgi:hypothetical protein